MTSETSPLDGNDSLAAQLMQHLQGAPLAQMADQLGIGTEEAHNAAAMAVPLLLGAMGRNAQDPAGAEALFGALERDHMPPAGAPAMSLGGLLGGLLGGGGSAPATGSGSEGASILGHLFGADHQQAEAGLAQATGLGNNASHLLRMLAPVVMAFVAHRMMSGGGREGGAGGLGGLLGQGQQSAAPGGSPAGDLLSRVLGQGAGAGGGLGDLIKMGTGLFGGRR